MAPHVVGIIQARMGSKRLPGKVLMPIRGVPALELELSRIRPSETLDAICIATSDLNVDGPIRAFARSAGIECVSGPEDDVLSRFALAARFMSADVVVRLTADCPFHDWRVVDQVVKAFSEGGAVYTSNALRRTFPVGLDCEVMATEALLLADAEAKDPVAREHVTPFLYRQGSCDVVHVQLPVNLSSLRWTLDTAEDLRAIRGIANALRGDDWAGASWTDILATVLSDPSLANVNAAVSDRNLT